MLKATVKWTMAKVPVFARVWESGTRIEGSMNENRYRYGSGSGNGVR